MGPRILSRAQQSALFTGAEEACRQYLLSHFASLLYNKDDLLVKVSLLTW